MASIQDFANSNKRIAILRDCNFALFDDIGKVIKANFYPQFYQGQALMTFGVDHTSNGDYIRVEIQKGEPYHLSYDVLKNAIIDGKVAVYKGFTDEIDVDFTNSISGKTTSETGKSSKAATLFIGGLIIAAIVWASRK